MSKADRLLELATLLRGREETTVERLADELGVARRTVFRDLAALRERGMPIRGDAGPGGGIRLEGDRGVTSVHLSITEVVALWLAARLSRAGSTLPWGEAATSGMNKLLASLPLAKSRSLRALCQRVIVGQPASPVVRAGASVAPPELLGRFEEAFHAGIGLAFDYVDRHGQTTSRQVEPHGLLVEPPVWYVLARDIAKGEPRTFRMDRISRPRILRDVTFRPDLRMIQELLPDHERWRPLTGRWPG